MRTKIVPLTRVKAGEADGLEAGQVQYYASVFNNVDSMGERMMPGAFTETLADWQKSGNTMPVIWSHDWSDPASFIGETLKAVEDDHGLQITAQLDIGENPKAMQVYKLLKGRRVNNASFAYDVLDYEEATKDGEPEPGGMWGFPVVNITKVKLFETGPCLIGANQETEFLAVKNEPLAKRLPVKVAVKGALPVSAGPKATTDVAWDGAAAEANLSNDDGASVYRQVYAWVDPDGDPDAKSSYKFPHHQVDSGGKVGAANVNACSAAIAALNGGRGGHSLNDTDRKGVYNHVKQHLVDSGRDPGDIAELATGDAQRSARARLSLSLVAGPTEVKKGARHSAADREAIQKIHDAACELGADCNAGPPPDEEDDGKAGRSRTKQGETYQPVSYHADSDETLACPECGLMNDTDAKFCDQCGNRLNGEAPYRQDDDETVFCPTCGLMNDTDARYCDQCGGRLAGRLDVTVMQPT